MDVREISVKSITIANRQRRNTGDLDGLIASIQSVGLLHPVVIGTDLRLKVGYRRLMAFQKMCRDTIPAQVTDNLDDVLAALRAERDENVQREELLPTEMVDRAAELDAEEARLARERSGMRTDLEPAGKFPAGEQGRARDKVADAFGVSGKTYEHAKEVVEAAEEEPEVYGDLPEKMDKKSVDAAYKELKKREREQDRAAMAQAAQDITPSDRWQVFHADMQTWVAPQRYDFIITDPPYPREYLPLYEALARRADDWLKPGGLLVAMCGQSYLDEIMAMMGRHLAYYWTAAYLTPGQPTPLRQRQVNTSWKPLLLFTRKGDTYKGKIFGDVFTSSGSDKEHHDWGQSVSGMLAVVQQICLPGQWILDPFCGAGATGVAALKHGCLFHGVEMNETSANLSKARLAEDD